MTETYSLLDNPIWNALSTRQSHFAEGDSLAKRFLPEIGPLTGLGEQTPEAYSSLARLLRPGEPGVLFLDSEPKLPEGWRMIMHKPLTQMICPTAPTGPEPGGTLLEPLGAEDVPAMVELTALTEPGPFRSRTFELGGFLGIRHSGRLVAMTGQRLAPPGFTEISAVCTHPDFRGRGYAQLLVAAVAKRVHERGETPFLTSFEHNTGAIRVYESVGFVARRSLHLAVVAAAAEEKQS
jgi:ribosomal protein S18 acetylase RimI-like enzyme